MTTARLLLAASVVFAAVPVASAQDRIIDAKHCSLFCKLQRNVTRDAGVSASEPIDGGYLPVERVPDAAEGSTHPDTAAIAAKRGQVMVETAQDRAARRRMERKMDRDTTMTAVSPVALNPKARKAQP